MRSFPGPMFLGTFLPEHPARQLRVEAGIYTDTLRDKVDFSYMFNLTTVLTTLLI